MMKKISVFLENHNGSLVELTSIFAEAGIDILALTIADTENFGIVRCIIAEEKLPEATALLTENGYTSRINHVICISVPDHAGGLHDVLTLLQGAEIGIEYMYSFVRPTAQKALLILRLSDNRRAEELFAQNGVEMLTLPEIKHLSDPRG